MFQVQGLRAKTTASTRAVAGSKDLETDDWSDSETKFVFSQTLKTAGKH